MSSKQIQYIEKLIKSGQKAEARDLLQGLMKKKASADLWVLMAIASESREDAIVALRKALDLDAMHSKANRLLLKIEGSKGRIGDRNQADSEEVKQILTKAKEVKESRAAVGKGGIGRLGCIALILLNGICAFFLLGAVGVIPGMLGRVNQIVGGPTPAIEIEGTPIASVPDAPLVLSPSLSESIETQDIDVLEHGYLHEYTFDVVRGDEVAILIQFLSVDANRVSRNVVLLNPSGENVTSICDRDSLLQDGDNGVTLICTVNTTGEWKVRLLGRQGESVGVYFIGVDVLADI